MNEKNVWDANTKTKPMQPTASNFIIDIQETKYGMMNWMIWSLEEAGLFIFMRGGDVLEKN